MKKNSLTRASGVLFLALFFGLCLFMRVEGARLDFHLKMGPYAAGFKTIHQYDYSRTFFSGYNLEGNAITENARPMFTAVWYPADPEKAKKSPRMKAKDYMALMAYMLDFTPRTAAEMEKEANDLFFEWSIAPERYSEADTLTNGVRDAEPADGRFPLIVYAPSLNAYAFENDALCEYLASWGYIIVANNSTDEQSPYIDPIIETCEVQSRDMRFLLGSMQQFPNVDLDKVVVMGYSWGGMAGVLTAMLDSRVKAIVCLDPSIMDPKNALPTARRYNPDKITSPFFLATSKEKPLEMWSKRGLTPPENQRCAFFDQLKYPEGYFIRFNKTFHADFSSMFIRFIESPPEFSSTLEESNQSYNAICQYVHMFLDAHVKGNAEALGFMKRTPVENGFADGLITMDAKKGKTPPPSTTEFIHNVRKNGLATMSAYYAEVKKDFPDYILDGNTLIYLASRLFTGEKYADCETVFRFYTEIHPEDFLGYFGIGEVCRAQGKLDKAEEAYKKAIELNPRDIHSIRALEKMKK